MDVRLAVGKVDYANSRLQTAAGALVAQHFA